MENTLPKGWVETPIENLFNLVYGKSISTKDLLNSDYNGDLYDVYGANGIIGKFSNYSYKNSKVIISCRGAASGKIHKTNPYSFISSNSIILDEINEALLNLDFVKYVMTIAEKSAIITGTAQPQITIQLLKDLKIPLPPLPEQERIVAKLDKLFAQHEKIKKALDRIPQLLKTFRQQVLTQAVTGKLTEQWREGKDLEEWSYMRISELGELISGFAFKSSDFNDAGIQLIRMGNLYNNKLDLSRSPIFLPKDYEAKLIERYSTQKGDILLSLTGTKYKRDYGFAIEINTNEKLLINQRILCIRPSINSKYLLYLLRDNIFRDQFFALETGGVNQGNVGVTNLAKIALEIPSFKEQQEIVRRVESLFDKADVIETRYQVLKAKIDSLPQAILHKAFKGELVPQLPTDGDAKDLLAEIMALKEETKGKRNKT